MKATYNPGQSQLSYLGYRTVEVKDMIPKSLMPDGTSWYIFSQRHGTDRQVQIDNEFVVFATEQSYTSGDSSNPLIGSEENNIVRWTVFDDVTSMSVNPDGTITIDYGTPTDLSIVRNGSEEIDFSAINIIQSGRMVAWLREYRHRNVTFDQLKTFIKRSRV